MRNWFVRSCVVSIYGTLPLLTALLAALASAQSSLDFFATTHVPNQCSSSGDQVECTLREGDDTPANFDLIAEASAFGLSAVIRDFYIFDSYVPLSYDTEGDCTTLPLFAGSPIYDYDPPSDQNINHVYWTDTFDAIHPQCFSSDQMYYYAYMEYEIQVAPRIQEVHYICKEVEQNSTMVCPLS